MLIREATSGDIPEILHLWGQTDLPLKPQGRDQPERLKRQLSSGNVWILLAEENEQLFGVVLVTHDGRKGWINRLATHPDYRRKGIAEMLLQAAENLLLENGIDVFAALIERNNIASRELFTKNGYNTLEDILYYSKKRKPES